MKTRVRPRYLRSDVITLPFSCSTPHAPVLQVFGRIGFASSRTRSPSEMAARQARRAWLRPPSHGMRLHPTRADRLERALPAPCPSSPSAVDMVGKRRLVPQLWLSRRLGRLASGLGCPPHSEGAPQSTRPQWLHSVRPSACATVAQFCTTSYPIHSPSGILSIPPHPIQPSTRLHILSQPYHTAALARGSGAGPSARARRCSCCSSAACCPEAAHRPRRLRRRQRRAPAPLRARRTPRRPGVACPTAWPKCEDDRPLRRSGACAQSLTAAFDRIQVRGSWPVRGARTN